MDFDPRGLMHVMHFQTLFTIPKFSSPKFNQGIKKSKAKTATHAPTACSCKSGHKKQLTATHTKLAVGFNLSEVKFPLTRFWDI